MSRLAYAEMLLFANRSAGSRMAGARKTIFLNGSNTIQKARGGHGGGHFGGKRKSKKALDTSAFWYYK